MKIKVCIYQIDYFKGVGMGQPNILILRDRFVWRSQCPVSVLDIVLNELSMFKK